MPEQSTAAMIVHHPEAKYYAVRGSVADVRQHLGLRSAASQAGEPLRVTEQGEATQSVDDAAALERAAAGDVTLAEAAPTPDF